MYYGVTKVQKILQKLLHTSKKHRNFASQFGNGSVLKSNPRREICKNVQVAELVDALL